MCLAQWYFKSQQQLKKGWKSPQIFLVDPTVWTEIFFVTLPYEEINLALAVNMSF